MIKYGKLDPYNGYPLYDGYDNLDYYVNKG